MKIFIYKVCDLEREEEREGERERKANAQRSEPHVNALAPPAAVSLLGPVVRRDLTICKKCALSKRKVLENRHFFASWNQPARSK